MNHTKTLLCTVMLLWGGAVQADALSQWLADNAQTAPQRRQAARYAGTVTAVADGDTLRVTDTHGRRHKIRLAYIDAPELQQAHGQAARQALSAAALGESVTVEVFETDRYRREVAKVSLNGRDLNLAQIAQGHAWHYAALAKRRQDKTAYAAYAYAQDFAGQERRGLWRGREPQAPWDFRRRAREAQQNGAAGFGHGHY